MEKKCFVFLLALVAPLLAKSQYYNYVPNTLNIPCLTKKGDINLGIGWGRGDAFQALELQGAYSLMPHIAMMANYFGARLEDVRSGADQGTDSYFWEAGGGIYEQSPKGSASLFAGYGSGQLFSNFRPGSTDLSAKLGIRRWFLQPGLVYRNKLFQSAVALRLSRIAYTKGEVSYSIESPYIDYIRQVEERSPLFLPELGLQAGIRIKPIFFSLSITSIFPNTTKLNFSRLNACLSLSTNFGVGKK